MGVPGIAQNPQSAYQTISTAQGLSQGMVFDILQDQEGFIWVATKNGLNRYDGYSFKVFSTDPYEPKSLSSNTILKLFEDSKGRIWVGTQDAGLSVYDKRSGKFVRITNKISDPTSLSGNTIRLMDELRDGRMLVAADGAGLNIVDLPATENAKPHITRLVLPEDVIVFGLGKDKDQQMWVGGMDRSVYRFDPARNSFIKMENGQLLHTGILTRDGSVVINRNVYLSDGKTILSPLFDTARYGAGNIVLREWKPLTDNYYGECGSYDISRLEPGKPLQWDLKLEEHTPIAYPFILDRSGILWSGSAGYGLRKYNVATSKFKTLLAGTSVRWIVPDAAGNIFAGNYQHEWFKLKGDSAYKKPFPSRQPFDELDNFVISRTGDYWFRTEKKGFLHYTRSGELTEYLFLTRHVGAGEKQLIVEDSKGRIWFPGRGGRLAFIDPVSKRIDSFSINTNNARAVPPMAIITALYDDGLGTYWIGTQEGFVSVTLNKNNQPDQIKWYYNNSNNRNSLNYNHVACFMNDPSKPDQYIWISTKGGGLNRLDKKTGNFFHLTTKRGMPDDVVYGTLPDNDGNVWGSTNNGLFCLMANKTGDSTNWSFRNFTKAYGLQDNEFNTGSYAKLKNGNLAFAGVNGLNVFDPKEVLSSGFSPNVFITGILVNNLPVTAGDESGVLQNTIEQTKSISLNHQQDILTLEFSSLDYTTPSQNKYRYQLVGLDQDWVESGTRQTATYLHLPPGKYTFKVQGSNSQGIWSDKIHELSVRILPPWWLSWWAYLAYAILLMLGIRAYFRFSVNRAKLKAQLNFEKLEGKRVKELDTAKTQLYTNITHEFRTPLTVIIGMAQQVIKKPEEQFDSRMNMIVRNGQSLLNLVNEMLDLSKLETGKMQLQLANGDIINFLRYIVESFHSFGEGEQKQSHFLTDIDALYVAYDPEKTRQIIVNLLSNALKFTPEKGNIYINVSKTESSTNPDEVTLIIKVKDTGIGIPEDQLLHIFDRFYQLDNSHTRKAEGTGIGLALTKELVKLMNGEIAAKSPPAGTNKGTEFTVTLPLAKSEAEVMTIEELIAEKKQMPVPPVNGKQAIEINNTAENAQRPMILLVEDNPDVVAYTASCLPDYRLAVGTDGKEGIAIATEIIPDLIITDVMMPFVDGFELCRRLRKDERTSHIPIIMLTAKADLASKIEGLEQGADVYLEKPFQQEELQVRIKKLLELRQTLQAYYLKKAGIGTTAIESETVEPAVLPQEIKQEDAFVIKVRKAIEDNLTNTDFTVEQLCKLIFMSHSQLHRKLDALTGYSPNRFIRIVRLNKAKELLKGTTDSIASIALDCGYSDPGYFARVFKQDTGSSPQDWRMENVASLK
jgi:signal transduction histidine kinase/DNA-binding response OmpR family regulator/ligand-binding sensor domain-containing protein